MKTNSSIINVNFIVDSQEKNLTCSDVCSSARVNVNVIPNNNTKTLKDISSITYSKTETEIHLTQSMIPALAYELAYVLSEGLFLFRIILHMAILFDFYCEQESRS